MHPIHRFLSEVSRKHKIARLNQFIEQRKIQSVLIVGASSSGTAYGNMIERFVQDKCESVVISGIEESSPLWQSWTQADGRDLPFADQAFDLVLSNAVIEHVGLEADQKAFVNEHQRCGRNWFLTTPNRLFPVEVHSGALFRHMGGNWVPPGTTRLLSRIDFRELVGGDAEIKYGLLYATLSAYGPISPTHDEGL